MERGGNDPARILYTVSGSIASRSLAGLGGITVGTTPSVASQQLQLSKNVSERALDSPHVHGTQSRRRRQRPRAEDVQWTVMDRVFTKQTYSKAL